MLPIGLTGLADVVYNRGTTLTMILDNRITAMTGHQHHPGTGSTLRGDPTMALNINDICKALGVNRIRQADPFDLKDLETAIREEAAVDEPSVIIVRKACTLMDKGPKNSYFIDRGKCVTCGLCMKLGCPAISKHEDVMSVDAAICVGCAVCVQVCKKDAITKAGGDNA